MAFRLYYNHGGQRLQKKIARALATCDNWSIIGEYTERVLFNKENGSILGKILAFLNLRFLEKKIGK